MTAPRKPLRGPRRRRKGPGARLATARTVPAGEQVSDLLRETWTPYRSAAHRHYGASLYSGEATREA